MFLKHFRTRLRESKKKNVSNIQRKRIKHYNNLQCNLVKTNILDVTFDLKIGTYYSYRKHNTEILYKHKQSSHPPSIIKQIPSIINKRVTDLSCDSDHFNKAAPHCVKSVQIRSFFWSIFSCIRTEYGDLRNKSPYSVRIQENTDQKNLRIRTLFMQCLITIQLSKKVVSMKI